ncbi:hypothetical protein J1614_010710 [Plenodomus biglobosus]|nr:hypothetical protein J1614_010710 [Plenodomus biglobosus]
MSLKSLLFFSLAASAARHGRSPVINTDVVIIGGGASGAYGAVRAREDLGKKVVVIERENRLGGHTSTWRDPVTGEPFDYGLEVFMNMTVSRNFMARFNVSLEAPGSATRQNLIADFSTGRPTNYSFPSDAETGAAMGRLAVEWDKYESMMLPTSLNFPAGNSLPDDLTLTWAEFARKYNVEAVTSTIWNSVAIDPSAALMIDMWKSFDPSVLRGQMVPISADNSEIFNKVAQLLGKDVMFETQVVSTKRSARGVQLQVRRRDGRMTTINAKRLLISIGPETLNRTVYDLDDQEEALFKAYTGNRYFAGVVTHPSLPAHLITNSNPAAAPSNHLITPDVPFLQSFNHIGNSSAGPVYRTIIAAPINATIEDAKSIVRNAIQMLMNAGTIPAGNVDQLDFKALDDHGMMYRHWSVEQLRSDIVRQTNALQGLRSTWYTGAAWATHNAAMVWNTTDAILPRMLQGM